MRLSLRVRLRVRLRLKYTKPAPPNISSRITIHDRLQAVISDSHVIHSHVVKFSFFLNFTQFHLCRGLASSSD